MRRVMSRQGDNDTNCATVGGIVLAILLSVYLFAALLFPERF